MSNKLTLLYFTPMTHSSRLYTLTLTNCFYSIWYTLLKHPVSYSQFMFKHQQTLSDTYTYTHTSQFMQTQVIHFRNTKSIHIIGTNTINCNTFFNKIIWSYYKHSNMYSSISINMCHSHQHLWFACFVTIIR